MMATRVDNDLNGIHDEDTLRQMWQKTEDLGRKKEIRLRMYKLREERLKSYYTIQQERSGSTDGNNNAGYKPSVVSSHAESLHDEGFMSAKTKEICDSSFPTFDTMTFKDHQNEISTEAHLKQQQAQEQLDISHWSQDRQLKTLSDLKSSTISTNNATTDSNITLCNNLPTLGSFRVSIANTRIGSAEQTDKHTSDNFHPIKTSISMDQSSPIEGMQETSFRHKEKRQQLVNKANKMTLYENRPGESGSSCFNIGDIGHNTGTNKNVPVFASDCQSTEDNKLKLSSDPNDDLGKACSKKSTSKTLDVTMTKNTLDAHTCYSIAKADHVTESIHLSSKITDQLNDSHLSIDSTAHKNEYAANTINSMTAVETKKISQDISATHNAFASSLRASVVSPTPNSGASVATSLRSSSKSSTERSSPEKTPTTAPRVGPEQHTDLVPIVNHFRNKIDCYNGHHHLDKKLTASFQNRLIACGMNQPTRCTSDQHQGNDSTKYESQPSRNYKNAISHSQDVCSSNKYNTEDYSTTAIRNKTEMTATTINLTNKLRSCSYSYTCSQQHQHKSKPQKNRVRPMGQSMTTTVAGNSDESGIDNSTRRKSYPPQKLHAITAPVQVCSVLTNRRSNTSIERRESVVPSQHEHQQKKLNHPNTKMLKKNDNLVKTSECVVPKLSNKIASAGPIKRELQPRPSVHQHQSTRHPQPRLTRQQKNDTIESSPQQQSFLPSSKCDIQKSATLPTVKTKKTIEMQPHYNIEDDDSTTSETSSSSSTSINTDINEAMATQSGVTIEEIIDQDYKQTLTATPIQQSTLNQEIRVEGDHIDAEKNENKNSNADNGETVTAKPSTMSIDTHTNPQTPLKTSEIELLEDQIISAGQINQEQKPSNHLEHFELIKEENSDYTEEGAVKQQKILKEGEIDGSIPPARVVLGEQAAKLFEKQQQPMMLLQKKIQPQQKQKKVHLVTVNNKNIEQTPQTDISETQKKGTPSPKMLKNYHSNKSSQRESSSAKFNAVMTNVTKINEPKTLDSKSKQGVTLLTSPFLQQNVKKETKSKKTGKLTGHSKKDAKLTTKAAEVKLNMFDQLLVPKSVQSKLHNENLCKKKNGQNIQQPSTSGKYSQNKLINRSEASSLRGGSHTRLPANKALDQLQSFSITRKANTNGQKQQNLPNLEKLSNLTVHQQQKKLSTITMLPVSPSGSTKETQFREREKKTHHNEMIKPAVSNKAVFVIANNRPDKKKCVAGSQMKPLSMKRYPISKITDSIQSDVNKANSHIEESSNTTTKRVVIIRRTEKEKQQRQGRPDALTIASETNIKCSDSNHVHRAEQPHVPTISFKTKDKCQASNVGPVANHFNHTRTFQTASKKSKSLILSGSGASDCNSSIDDGDVTRDKVLASNFNKNVLWKEIGTQIFPARLSPERQSSSKLKSEQHHLNVVVRSPSSCETIPKQNDRLDTVSKPATEIVYCGNDVCPLDGGKDSKFMDRYTDHVIESEELVKLKKISVPRFEKIVQLEDNEQKLVEKVEQIQDQRQTAAATSPKPIPISLQQSADICVLDSHSCQLLDDVRALGETEVRDDWKYKDNDNKKGQNVKQTKKFFESITHKDELKKRALEPSPHLQQKTNIDMTSSIVATTLTTNQSDSCTTVPKKMLENDNQLKPTKPKLIEMTTVEKDELKKRPLEPSPHLQQKTNIDMTSNIVAATLTTNQSDSCTTVPKKMLENNNQLKPTKPKLIEMTTVEVKPTTTFDHTAIIRFDGIKEDSFLPQSSANVPSLSHQCNLKKKPSQQQQQVRSYSTSTSSRTTKSPSPSKDGHSLTHLDRQNQKQEQKHHIYNHQNTSLLQPSCSEEKFQTNSEVDTQQQIKFNKIENIFDLDLLHSMLEQVSRYDIRSQIRARIRSIRRDMELKKKKLVDKSSTSPEKCISSLPTRTLTPSPLSPTVNTAIAVHQEGVKQCLFVSGATHISLPHCSTDTMAYTQNHSISSHNLMTSAAAVNSQSDLHHHSGDFVRMAKHSATNLANITDNSGRPLFGLKAIQRESMIRTAESNSSPEQMHAKSLVSCETAKQKLNTWSDQQHEMTVNLRLPMLKQKQEISKKEDSFKLTDDNCKSNLLSESHSSPAGSLTQKISNGSFDKAQGKLNGKESRHYSWSTITTTTKMSAISNIQHSSKSKQQHMDNTNSNYKIEQNKVYRQSHSPSFNPSCSQSLITKGEKGAQDNTMGTQETSYVDKNSLVAVLRQSQSQWQSSTSYKEQHEHHGSQELSQRQQQQRLNSHIHHHNKQCLLDNKLYSESDTKAAKIKKKVNARALAVPRNTMVATDLNSTTKTSSVASSFAKFRQLERQNSLPSSATSASADAIVSTSTKFKFNDSKQTRSASSIKDRLLDWVKAQTKDYENVQIDNFSSSWNNGLAFCALIHHFYPHAFDYDKLTPQQRRYNFELAFKVAEQEGGIVPLLDVDDMVTMKRPDWKCVFTYVQSIYQRFHASPEANKP